MNELTEKITSFIKENHYNVYSLAIMGDEINESLHFQNTSRCHNSYSVAKAFTTTAIGMCFDRGLLSPEDKITDILRKYVPDNIDPLWEKVTVHDALLHKMGMPMGYMDIDASNDPNEFGYDQLSYMFNTKLDCEPGTRWSYSDGGFYVLARVVEELVHERQDDFLWHELFFPMGFKEVAWSKCPGGHTVGGSGLYIASDDMVKLGELYRNGGIYNGIRIISEKWVNLVLSRGYELNPQGVSDTYGKGGYSGQMLVVFPSKKFSVAYHSFGFDDHVNLIKFIDDNT